MIGLSQSSLNNYNTLMMFLLNELGGGTSENRDYVSNLLSWLSVTPKFTAYRVNTLNHTGEEVKEIINLELSKQASARGVESPFVSIHPTIPELIVVSSWSICSSNLHFQEKEVIVDVACGTAVLRGAQVYAPGVKGMGSGTLPGDYVSVYADIENKCTRGLMCSFTEAKYFVGNGIVKIGRSDLFGKNAVLRGVAVEMTHTQSHVPCLPVNCVPDTTAMLQNLPSVLCCKTLNPCAGERVLDMCAAPGNKTSHLAMLMNNEGTLIALDKTAIKVQLIQNRCRQFGITCVKSFVYDSTKAVRDVNNSEEEKCEMKDICLTTSAGTEDPPFPSNSFDRILLDAPCSALGQRPQLTNNISLKQLKSYPPLQRKLFQSAVSLLKPGGRLVYSTCTVTMAENEHLVKWALEKFPFLELVAVDPVIGGPGIETVGLSEKQLQCVRRFGPPMHSVESYYNNYNYNHDTVGFFIAHFVKHQK